MKHTMLGFLVRLLHSYSVFFLLLILIASISLPEKYVTAFSVTEFFHFEEWEATSQSLVHDRNRSEKDEGKNSVRHGGVGGGGLVWPGGSRGC